MQTTLTTGYRGRPGHRTIRTGAISLRLNLRVLGLCAIAFVALLALMVWATTLGSYAIPFSDVVLAVLGKGTANQDFVVRSLRLPRVISAVLIGAALAMSGSIFQGLVRNPLVSPDIIGIESGASAAAVVWIITGQDWNLLAPAAFLGALATAGLIYILSWKRGISPNRLILVGIGVGAAASSITTFMLVRYPVDQVRQAQVWTIGSLYASSWDDVKVLLVVVAIGLPAAIALTWPLRALQLGDDVTRGLGVSLERTRLITLLLGCALAGAAVAVAGPIGFVALMVPHIARMIAGPLSGSVMLFTAIFGSCFVLSADVVGQHFMPVSLPVGVLTAVVGAPYFLYLLYRTNAKL